MIRRFEARAVARELVEFAPELAGRVTAEPDDLATRADDFGHIVHDRPLAVVEPRQPDHIAPIVRFAARSGLKVAARGRGHSTSGQAQAGGGLVVDMAALNRRAPADDASVWVEAGSTWWDVASHAFSRGLIPPVMPSYPGLSVGGTLSVGGIGRESFRAGTLADNVLELRVVTGAGELTTCSPWRSRELFAGTLAGLGQLGVIVEARLRLVRAARLATQTRLLYIRLSELLGDLGRLADERRFDGLQGSCFPASLEAIRARFGDSASHGRAGDGWLFMLEATKYHDDLRAARCEGLLGHAADVPSFRRTTDLSRLELIERSLPLSNQDEMPTARHPGVFVIVPAGRAEAMLTELLDDLDPASMGEDGVLVVPLRQDALLLPFLRTPPARDLVLVAFERTVPTSEDLDPVLAQHDRIRGLARRFGGVRYLIDVPLRPGDEARRHFGEQWDRLVGLKERHDPSRSFAPNQGLFGRR